MEPRPVLSAYLTIWAVLAGHGRTVAQLWTAREFRFYRCLLHSGRAAHISRILPPHVLADQSKFRSGLSPPMLLFAETRSMAPKTSLLYTNILRLACSIRACF